MIDDLPALIRKVDALKRDKDRAEGALQQIKERIQKEFGCKTIKEAKTLLDTLLQEEISYAEKYTKAKTRFEKELIQKPKS